MGDACVHCPLPAACFYGHFLAPSRVSCTKINSVMIHHTISYDGVRTYNGIVGAVRSVRHYGRDKISRVSLASPSAKNRALGKENLPRVLHSGNNYTRGREVFLSAAEILALDKEQHSAKALFPECNTRGRSALGKQTCYLTVRPAHAVKT